MIPSNVFLYASAAFTFFASATATYKTGAEFFDDLPDCIQDCLSAEIDMLNTACESSTNNLQCVCEYFVKYSSSASSTNSTSATCALGCSKEDQDATTKAGMNFANDCIPYITDTGSSNSTSTSTASGSASASGASSTALPSESATGSPTGSDSSSSETASATDSPTATRLTTSTTPSGTGAPAATQSTGGAASLLVNSLFVVAVPAVLSGLFM